MVIKVNGDPLTLAGDSVSILKLLTMKNVEMPEMVSVQLNGEFINRENLENTRAQEGDEVDFLYFMGGG